MEWIAIGVLALWILSTELRLNKAIKALGDTMTKLGGSLDEKFDELERRIK